MGVIGIGGLGAWHTVQHALRSENEQTAQAAEISQDSSTPPAPSLQDTPAQPTNQHLEESGNQMLILDQPTPTSAPQPETGSQGLSDPGVTQWTIRILDGGHAASTTKNLRTKLIAAGFNVLSTGTAIHAYSTTTIYYQSGHETDAKTTGTYMNGSSIQYEQDPIAAPADVLIVVGTSS